MNLKIEISSSSPIIKGNFEDLRSHLITELKQYDLIVDANSIKTAKKMATEINKLSQQIDTVRKEKVSELSAPIKEFELEAKSLTTLCQESRQKLLSQVKIFEDKERDRALKLLTVLKSEIETKYGIKEGFEIEIPFDLAILSNLTKNGLSKKAKDEVDVRVLAKKQFQEQIDTRLSTLESICYKGGLEVPLTRENINHFLMEANDDIYLKKLVSLIKNEIFRLEKAKQLKKEQETERVAINELKQPLATHLKTQIKQNNIPKEYAHFKNLQEFTPVRKISKKTYVVTATFEIEFDETKAYKLSDLLKEKFLKTGFKQVPDVFVEEKLHVA